MLRLSSKARLAHRGPRIPRTACIRRKSTKSLSKLKNELDAIFSRYVRSVFPKECYTCRATDKTLQCGHFVSRTYLATRWDLNNCRPQCVGCNIWGNGKTLDFEERLREELGETVVNALKLKRKETFIPTKSFYEQQISHYRALVDNS